MRRSFLFSLLLLSAISAFFSMYCMYMPGDSSIGATSELSSVNPKVITCLQNHVKELSISIGERNYHVIDNLDRTADYIQQSFETSSLKSSRQTYSWRYKDFHNIEGSILAKEQSKPLVIVGAHYDTTDDGVGANDNASGVAALLCLSELFSKHSQSKWTKLNANLVFVAFANEEPPFFGTPFMGSAVYAKSLKASERSVKAMLSLETMGYYTDKPGSQSYPPPLKYFYPSTGNFIGFVGNLSSASLVREAIGVYRQYGLTPSEGAALPAFIPGVGWSDHASFWDEDFPAIMITDTAPNRYPYYHTAQDTYDKINFHQFSNVVLGLERVIMYLLK